MELAGSDSSCGHATETKVFVIYYNIIMISESLPYCVVSISISLATGEKCLHSSSVAVSSLDSQ